MENHILQNRAEEGNLNLNDDEHTRASRRQTSSTSRMQKLYTVENDSPYCDSASSHTQQKQDGNKTILELACVFNIRDFTYISLCYKCHDNGNIKHYAFIGNTCKYMSLPMGVFAKFLIKMDIIQKNIAEGKTKYVLEVGRNRNAVVVELMRPSEYILRYYDGMFLLNKAEWDFMLECKPILLIRIEEYFNETSTVQQCYDDVISHNSLYQNFERRPFMIRNRSDCGEFSGNTEDDALFEVPDLQYHTARAKQQLIRNGKWRNVCCGRMSFFMDGPITFLNKERNTYVLYSLCQILDPYVVVGNRDTQLHLSLHAFETILNNTDNIEDCLTQNRVCVLKLDGNETTIDVECAEPPYYISIVYKNKVIRFVASEWAELVNYKSAFLLGIYYYIRNDYGSSLVYRSILKNTPLHFVPQKIFNKSVITENICSIQKE